MLVIRRGTDTERATVTFAEGEFVYTTDLQEVWIGDGATAGGIIVTGAGGGTIDDTAWNPTSWDANLDGASKNAIRDIIVAILAKVDFITVTQAVDLDTIESDTVANNAKVSNATHTGEVTGSGVLTVDKTAISGKGLVTAAMGDHLLIGDVSDADNLKKVLVSDIAYPAADATKVAFITITQAVDLDTLESDTVANNAKVTNATHTGEVTGSGVLSADKTIISNRALVTAVGTDHIMIGDTSDGDNLKKALVSDLLGGGGPADTDALPEGVVNLYYSPALAKSDAVDDAIVDGVTDVAPSQNSVFDALALKAPITSPVFLSSMEIPVAAGYAPTADGSIGYDTTQGRYVAGGNGAIVGGFPRIIGSGIGTQAFINSTTADQDFTSLMNLSANSLFTNKIYRVNLIMEFVTGVSTATIIPYLKFGATKTFIGEAVNITNSVTRSTTLQFTITGRAAPGAAAATTTVPLGAFGANMNGTNTVNQPVNLATNGALAVTAGVTYSATGSTESAELQAWFIEELN